MEWITKRRQFYFITLQSRWRENKTKSLIAWMGELVMPSGREVERKSEGDWDVLFMREDRIEITGMSLRRTFLCFWRSFTVKSRGSNSIEQWLSLVKCLTKMRHAIMEGVTKTKFKWRGRLWLPFATFTDFTVSKLNSTTGYLEDQTDPSCWMHRQSPWLDKLEQHYVEQGIAETHALSLDTLAAWIVVSRMVPRNVLLSRLHQIIVTPERCISLLCCRSLIIVVTSSAADWPTTTLIVLFLYCGCWWC